MFRLVVQAIIFIGSIIIYPFEKAAVLVYDYLFLRKDGTYAKTKRAVKVWRGEIAAFTEVVRKMPGLFRTIRKYKATRFMGIRKQEGISKFARLLTGKRIWKVVLPFFVGMLFMLVFVVIPIEIVYWFRELPRPEMLVSLGSNKSTRLLDRNGKLLYEIYVDKQYDPVKLSEVPKDIINATLAVEDARFYNHSGIRLASMARAAIATIFGGSMQGGSTITQQLVKNVLLTPERTISRKLKEVALALSVEAKYSKDQILELYLNNISYGGTAWGIQTASRKYFDKNVWELDLAEGSLLAGLPSAPSDYSPIYDLASAKNRQRYVLDRMVILGFITSEVANTAYNEPLVFADGNEYIRAPHFVELVRRYLKQKYGERYVNFGGLTVTTSLDLDLQDKVQKIVADEVARSANLNISNGAAVVLNAKSGEILAHVGSVDYFKDNWGAFDVASAYRQPGSSIKPVTYALAFTKGFTPATVIKDAPVTYQTPGSKPYTPVNYDGAYHGDVTLRTALANSYNVPAVKLAKQLGPDNIVSMGKQLGLPNWETDGNYGLSITLGGKEVTLLGLTNVYATFARKGEFHEVTPVLTISDAMGYEIFNSNNTPSVRVLSEEVAYLLWHILSDNNARTPAFGTNNFLSLPGYKIAVKTGTTDEKRDNWTFGFTPMYVVGVWVGNNDNSPMNKYLASGLSGAAPIWNKIFGEVLQGKQNETFAMPAGVFVKADPACKGASEVFIKGSNVPAHLCVIEKDRGKKDKKKKD